MSDKGKDNPGYVGIDLCEAYREAVNNKIDGVEMALTARINSIKTIIVLTVSVSTAFISIAMWFLKKMG